VVDHPDSGLSASQCQRFLSGNLLVSLRDVAETLLQACWVCDASLPRSRRNYTVDAEKPIIGRASGKFIFDLIWPFFIFFPVYHDP
jgi:hypothetical protein